MQVSFQFFMFFFAGSLVGGGDILLKASALALSVSNSFRISISTMVQKGFPLFITVDLEDLIAGLHEMHLLSGEKTFTIAQCSPDPYKFILFFLYCKTVAIPTLFTQ